MPKRLSIPCSNCGKPELSRDEIGINKKLLGENVPRPMCLTCFAEYLDVTEEDLLSKIEEFKASGCKLFS